MDSLQGLKSRSKAVKNVGQITKAMEVVAATKMRRAQEYALRSRPYAFRALELLELLALRAPLSTPLSASREVKRTLMMIVASDKGLTGSFNAQVFRAFERFLADDVYRAEQSHTYRFLAVGKKAEQFLTRRGCAPERMYAGAGDWTRLDDIDPIAEYLMNGYRSGSWDRVVVVSTHFRTALRQEPLTRVILPVDVEHIRETVREIVPEHGRYADPANGHEIFSPHVEYIFEPSPEAVLEVLMPHLVRMQLYHLMLEANASEHSARRVAMKTASDNADELLSGLTLEYNKVRQASITKELIEITSTQNALS